MVTPEYLKISPIKTIGILKTKNLSKISKELLNAKSGPCRDRTDDPRIKSPLLYRLS